MSEPSTSSGSIANVTLDQPTSQRDVVWRFESASTGCQEAIREVSFVVVAPVLVVEAGPAADMHDTGWGHPERAERLRAVEAGTQDPLLEGAVARTPARPATRHELVRVHTAGYIDALRDFIAADGGDIDPDTHVSTGSWDAALLAAGAGLTAIESLDRGEASSAFVAVRPPGHHATQSAAMGFCLLNNAAVTAAALADRGERVLIVDWDVHHGNGTQDIFWDDPRVMYISTHQWPAYPGTGRAQDTGGPGAPGLTINVPLPEKATGDVARRALERIAAPEIEKFDPTWVVVSAGFDAHRADPLADLAWSAGDFADLTADVATWAPRPGRMVVLLDGGYDLDALRMSVTATIAAMAGERYHPEAPTSGGPGLDLVDALAALRHRLLGS
jgi:acetoin utilization deacetylase AcuC-like enzyme